MQRVVCLRGHSAHTSGLLRTEPYFRGVGSPSPHEDSVTAAGTHPRNTVSNFLVLFLLPQFRCCRPRGVTDVGVRGRRRETGRRERERSRVWEKSRRGLEAVSLDSYGGSMLLFTTGRKCGVVSGLGWGQGRTEHFPW